MEAVYRTPSFKIEVIRPDWGSVVEYKYVNSTPYAVFLSAQEVNVRAGEYNNLLSYSFSHSLADLSGSFSFSMREPRAYLYDQFSVMDFVYIFEFGELRFIGIVRQVSWSGQMSESGGRRVCTVSGTSATVLLSEYKLILDQAIFATSVVAGDVQERLAIKLAGIQNVGTPIRSAMIAVYDAWINTMAEIVEEPVITFSSLLNGLFDLSSETSDKVVFWYPAAYSIFANGEQDLLSVLQQFVQPPLMEFFARPDDRTKKMLFYLRLVPFGLGKNAPALLDPGTADAQQYLGDWYDLPINSIPTVLISNMNLVKSDANIYSYYFAYPDSGGFNSHATMIAAGSPTGGGSKVDIDKWRKYGYRPLIVPFKFFKRDTIDNLLASSTTVFGRLSKAVYEAFHMNDELVQGTITMASVPLGFGVRAGSIMGDPKIGERVNLEGSEIEFYVEQTAHSWTYGGPMTTELKVSRGANYRGGAVKAIGDIDLRLGTPAQTIIPIESTPPSFGVRPNRHI